MGTHFTSCHSGHHIPCQRVGLNPSYWSSPLLMCSLQLMMAQVFRSWRAGRRPGWKSMEILVSSLIQSWYAAPMEDGGMCSSRWKTSRSHTHTDLLTFFPCHSTFQANKIFFKIKIEEDKHHKKCKTLCLKEYKQKYKKLCNGLEKKFLSMYLCDNFCLQHMKSN